MVDAERTLPWRSTRVIARQICTWNDHTHFSRLTSAWRGMCIYCCHWSLEGVPHVVLTNLSILLPVLSPSFVEQLIELLFLATASRM